MFKIGDRVICIHSYYHFTEGMTGTVNGLPGIKTYDDKNFSSPLEGMTITAKHFYYSGEWTRQYAWRKQYKYDNLEPHGGTDVT